MVVGLIDKLPPEIDAALAVVGEILAPPERLTVSEWADRHRKLNVEFSAEPGNYQTSRTPYLRWAMDVYASPLVWSITIKKPSRCGGTELMNNCLAWAMDVDPGPTIYVYPTEDDCREESAGRLTALFQDSPRLRRHIPFAGWNTAKMLNLRGERTVYMAWPRAPRTLVRRTAMRLFFDELDNCEKQAGALGEHLTLAAERTLTYGHRGKVCSATTPTHASAAGERAFLASLKFFYHMPCPHCGTYQVFAWANLKFPKGTTAAALENGTAAAYMKCTARKCGKKITEADRWWCVERGLWVSDDNEVIERLPVHDPDIVEAAALPPVDGTPIDQHEWEPKTRDPIHLARRVGIKLNPFASPWRTFAAIAAAFLNMKGNPETLRVFFNQILGECFTDVAEVVEPEDIRHKRDGAYPRDILPPDVQVVMMGVDTQSTHFVYTVYGFAPRRQTYLIREGYAESFGDLMTVAHTPFAVHGHPDKTIRPTRLAIDSGGDRTADVYLFAKRTPGVYAVKGREADVPWPVRPSKIEYTPKGSTARFSLTLYHVNVSYYKGALLRAMKVPPGDPGAWHVHADTSDEFFDQVTSEVLEWQTVNNHGRKSRRQVWQKKTTHAANHYLDATVYVMAIADLLGVTSLRDPAAPAPPRVPPSTVSPTPSRPRSTRPRSSRKLPRR